MSTVGGDAGGRPAWTAWARPISRPSGVTAELLPMFCALNGATATPRSRVVSGRPRRRVRSCPRPRSCPPAAARRAGSRRAVRPRDYRRPVRFLLRPGWLAFIALAVGFALICCTLLAPWQFGREERQAQERAISTANAAPPVPLADLAPAGTAVGYDVEWRRVTATGTYLPEAEAVVRLRVVDGKPAVEVLTLLRLDDGRIVAVDRGWVAVENGQQTPAYPAPPAGTVTVTRSAARRPGRPGAPAGGPRGGATGAVRRRLPRRPGRRPGSTSPPGTCSWRTACPGCSGRCP